MQKTIDELLAEAAIREIHVRYCRAVDRMDFDLLRTCFHSDAVAEYGFFVGGVDEFVAMAKDSLTTYTGTTHFTGNQLVEVSGDSAWAEHYTSATHHYAAATRRAQCATTSPSSATSTGWSAGTATGGSPSGC